MAGEEEVEIIRPPNLLKQKVGGGSFDAKVIAKAEAAVVETGKNYIDVAKADLQRLLDAVARLQKEPSNAGIIDEIYAIAHELKGQGATFGYPLISQISHLLSRYLDPIRKSGGTPNQAVVSAHIDSLRAIVLGNIKGDGGPIGIQITDSLQKVVAKLSAA